MTWVPDACTLPTAERPLRQAEFADLFATARESERLDPTTLRVELEPRPEVAAKAASLMVRENACCSFFTFTLTSASGGLSLRVKVPDAYADVLDQL